MSAATPSTDALMTWSARIAGGSVGVQCVAPWAFDWPVGFYIALSTIAIVSTLVNLGGLFVSVMEADRKSTRLNSSHSTLSRMPSSA